MQKIYFLIFASIGVKTQRSAIVKIIFKGVKIMSNAKNNKVENDLFFVYRNLLGFLNIMLI